MAGGAISLSDLAGLLGGSVDGDASRVVAGIASLEVATVDDVSFCASAAYRSLLSTAKAGAVIVAKDFEAPGDLPDGLALIRVDHPYVAVAGAVRHFYPEPGWTPGVDDSAVVAPDAVLDDGVAIAAGAIIGAGARIGRGTRIGAGSVVEPGVSIGSDCRVHANVSLYADVSIGDRVILHAGVVVGADGFGYATDRGQHTKIPQVGTVVVEDDVEIGANSCVDRAALGATYIREGTKIDNLVQIGHNCDVGPHAIISGQVGVGGSTTIGRSVMIGGKAGLGDHISIGEYSMIGANAGVTSSVPAGSRVAGYPHADVSLWRRSVVAVRSLPELVRRVRRLEASLETRDEKEK